MKIEWYRFVRYDKDDFDRSEPLDGTDKGAVLRGDRDFLDKPVFLAI